MKNIYGFKLLDRNGNGFKRWFNGETKLTTYNPLGRLPNTLNSINIAQEVMQFKDAYHYCFKAAIKHDLQFTLLNETNWKALEHPVKRFFKQLLKRL
jgi:hypothetical protein